LSGAPAKPLPTELAEDSYRIGVMWHFLTPT
jgi:hypothetical protein